MNIPFELYVVVLLISIPATRSKVYDGHIRVRTRPGSRSWGGLSTNTGNVGGWLIRITNADGAFACCGAYYSPLLVLTSANCIQPLRWTLNGATADGTALLDSETDNYSEIDYVYVPDDFVAGKSKMDIAVVKLRKPIRGLMTEFIRLCSSQPPPHAIFNSFGWGYSNLIFQRAATHPKFTEVNSEEKSLCNSRSIWKESLPESVMCVNFPRDRTQCIYDGASPLTYKRSLCGIASIGSTCQNTSIPGIYTDITKVKWYITQIRKNIKLGFLSRRKRELPRNRLLKTK